MLERYKDGRWMAHGRFCALWVGTLLLLGACVELARIKEPHPKQDREWFGWPMPNPDGTGLPNPANYTVNAAADMVTDNVTKLMWQRNIDAGLYAWAEAQTYCADLDYGGYDDWRLPTAIELVSLVDFTKVSPGPTIDTDAFPNTPAAHFWTSSPLAGSASNAWVVFFGRGDTNLGDVTDAVRVRCVR